MDCGCKKKQKELTNFLIKIEKEIKSSMGDEDQRAVQFVQKKFLLGVYKIFKDWKHCGCFIGKILTPVFMLVVLKFRDYETNSIMINDLSAQYKFVSHSISELNV